MDGLKDIVRNEVRLSRKRFSIGARTGKGIRAVARFDQNASGAGPVSSLDIVVPVSDHPGCG